MPLAQTLADMNAAYALPGNQNDYGGTGACAAIACALAVQALVDTELLRAPLHELARRFDETMRQTAAEWSAMRLGFLTPAEVLEKFTHIGDELYIEGEVASDIAGPLCDEMGCEIVPATGEVLLAWMQSSDKAQRACLLTRGGYSFLLLYATPYYHIVDSHANTMARHADSMRCLAEPGVVSQTPNAALLLRTMQPAQVTAYVLQYAPHDAKDRSDTLTSSNQVDFTFLALKL